MTTAWLANTDIAPCIESPTILNYIGKYYTKSKIKSESYKDIVKFVITKINANISLISLVLKIINRFIDERDWST